MILKYTIAWLGMVCIAILNGAARQLGYARLSTELFAHQVSCLTGITLFLIYTWLLSIRWPIESSGQALTIGLIWLALTTAFECLFGRYAAKASWQELLHDYNILQGRLWMLVLVGVFLAPYLVYTMS